ncbi:MAG TPA: enoyl-CoA hydratase-related protein [Candidatus Polarisedimenticolaceae bacterium]|nr:enoyl-CoA hydratase-related protein [Candidatus Polarisedimenticolaceae bacterium]
MRLVQIESATSGVRTLVLDRPPVNALGHELVDELTVALGRLSSDDQARCLIVRSAGAHFCAGADLKERATMSVEEVREFVPRLAGVCSALAAIPYPTIAELRGAAAGGGCELALACDLRVMAEDGKIGLRETALAIIPGAGGTQRLPRLIGPMKAKRWIFSAAMHDAAEALADGVVQRVVPQHRLNREVQELAEAIAACGPLANRLAKRAIDRGAELPIDRGLQLEWECYQETLQTEDRVEALRAFAEKRPPRFGGK